MDPESKKLLEETFQLAKENNKMLHKVRNVQKWATFWQSLKVIIIIGVAVGAFYYLEPYLNSMLNLYNSISGFEQNITGGGGSFMNFLSNFKN
jgi:hypothetical protein